MNSYSSFKTPLDMTYWRKSSPSLLHGAHEFLHPLKQGLLGTFPSLLTCLSFPSILPFVDDGPATASSLRPLVTE